MGNEQVVMGMWGLGNGLVYVDKCLRGKWGVEIVERA